MSKKIYKYIGPEILEIAFKKENFCGLKFSYPKDYNDPYELFLTINYNNDPEILAFYKEVVSEIHQYPTTCFSKSPNVIPMWAHYAHDSKGFVLEVDESKLTDFYKDASLNDITYQNEPRSDLEGTLQMAYGRRKPRDLMFLRQGVDYAAYFTKNSCWEYELERRLVINDHDIENIHGNMISFIPTDCISSIISGSRAKPNTIKQGIELSKKINTRFFKTNIGRTTSSPYLTDIDANTFIFDGNNIIKSPYSCNLCKEPLANEAKELCSWCSITEDHRFDASINPLRMFSDAGTLDSYVAAFQKIGK